jgi:spermidine synthase
MVLYKHDREFSIRINGQELMNSRQHESELELARLGCAALADRPASSVLIGGLGLGYTLRQALDLLGPDAEVVVGELLGAVVEWNRRFLGELNGNPLEDERVDLRTGDVVELISRSQSQFDAILLDIDNGPSALTAPENRYLYGREGIRACRRALRQGGCLALWSPEPNKGFEQLLVSGNFHVRRYRVPAYKGSHSQSRFVWVASEDKTVLPPGGGEPRLLPKNESRGSARRTRGRR